MKKPKGPKRAAFTDGAAPTPRVMSVDAQPRAGDVPRLVPVYVAAGGVTADPRAALPGHTKPIGVAYFDPEET
jgi:hypothetical protein